MPLLAGLLTQLFIGIASFFAKWITRKVAAIAAGIAIMSVITGTLYLVGKVLVTGLLVAFPMTPWLSTGIWIMIPDNAGVCMAAMFATDMAVAVYRLNVLNVQFAVYAP